MVWARGIVGRHPGSAAKQIVDQWLSGNLTAVVSGELLSEIEGTLAELGVRSDELFEILMLIGSRSEIFAIQHQRMGCDDEDDDHLLELAVTANADFLISEDKAVYELPPHVHEYIARNSVRVIRAADFASEITS